MNRVGNAWHMTEAQKNALRKIPHHQVLAELTTGALVIVFRRFQKKWMVVDLDGSIYEFSAYLALLDQRA